MTAEILLWYAVALLASLLGWMLTWPLCAWFGLALLIVGGTVVEMLHVILIQLAKTHSVIVRIAMQDQPGGTELHILPGGGTALVQKEVKR